MDISKTITNMKSNEPKILSEEIVQSIISKSNLLTEQDTLISRHIRLMKYKHVFIVQERSSKQEIILRKFTNFDKASKFITERMIVYEKMWDGCGCKINYYQ